MIGLEISLLVTNRFTLKIYINCCKIVKFVRKIIYNFVKFNDLYNFYKNYKFQKLMIK